jgi:uncharacterized protein (UPF0548 family)
VIEEGSVIAQAIQVGPLTAIACCRIVKVVDEEHAFGFAYGTLPAHPERGEEAFMVSRNAGSGTVTISAFSRPSHVLSRLGRPLTHLIQDRVTDRYLAGLIVG